MTTLRALTILVLPAPNCILDAGQAARTGISRSLIFDQPLRRRPVSADLAQQIVKKRRLPHGAREQFLSGMRLATQLAHPGFDLERKPALRLGRGTVLFLFSRIGQICPAVRTFQQARVNIRAAISAFGFIVFGRGSDTGGHIKYYVILRERTRPKDLEMLRSHRPDVLREHDISV